MSKCSYCEGTGVAIPHMPFKCEMCKGTKRALTRSEFVAFLLERPWNVWYEVSCYKLNCELIARETYIDELKNEIRLLKKGIICLT